MKISKLLVLTALWLGISTSAKAADLTGVWTVAEPAGLVFTDVVPTNVEEAYLYNPTAKMFFASGNEWNTRAGIDSFGYYVYFSESTEADAPEGSYEFWNLCTNPNRVFSNNTNLFTDDGGSTWVDHAQQGNYSWSVEKVGDCYRFQNVALIADKPEFDGKYFGWKGDFADTRLYMITPEEGAVDWKFVTAESYTAFVNGDDYEAYKKSVATCAAALNLKAAIEAAEAVYVNVADAVAIYNNAESTAEQMTTATTSLKEITDVKAKLKAAIEEYEAKGFTATEAAKAVLTNLASTKAEVEKAHSDLNAAYVEWGSTQASVEKPIDLTSKIINPHFDNGDCTTGWSGTAFGRGGTVSDGAEHYSKNYDTYQTITGLTPGIYAVGVYGYFRAGNYGGAAEGHWLAKDEASKYAKLYGKVGDKYYEAPMCSPMSGAQAETQTSGESEVTYQDAEGNDVTVFVPNTMAAGDYYIHTLNQYANKVYVAVDESGELTIGVKKETQLDGDWSFFDDFSLTFYGQGADACQLFLDEALKNYGEVTVEEGTLYTASYLTAYQDVIKGEKTASTMEEVNAIIARIDAAYNAIQKNIELWATWNELVAEGYDMAKQPKYNAFVEQAGDLADYAEFESVEILDAKKLTNEELETEIATIKGLIEALLDAYKKGLADNTDVTDMIKNPGFDADKDINSGAAEGWTIDRVDGGNVTRGPLGADNKKLMEEALGEMNYCFESWHCHKWDVWQELENLPIGLYELQVQGYVRCEVGGYNRGDDIEPNYPSPVYLYMNNAMSSFPSVYSEAAADLGKDYTTVESWTVETINGTDYPNSMGGAAQCFGWGMYKTTAWGLIAREGDKFRIGVKMDANQDWWCIWDSFKLIYHKATIESVKPLLEERIAELSLDKPMGKDVYERAEAIKKIAAEATTVEQLFDALDQTYNLQADIIASIALFKELADANDSFNEAINESENDDAKAKATDLYNLIANGITNHTITDAEVARLLEQISELRTQLGFPAGWENASDENPADFTDVIVNASYDEDAKGWSGTEAAYNDLGLVEIFGKNFDYYQEFVGMPEGTYELGVQGFYRAGGASEDYNAYVENPETLNHAFVYAMDGDSAYFSKPLPRLASEPIEGDMGDGYAVVKEATDEADAISVPNTMSTASDEFMNDKYAALLENGVIFKVKADGKLRIGLKKTTDIANNWTIWDNWKLTYYGKNSAKTVDGNPLGIASATNGLKMKVEYFMLDGRKATAAQKGIMIQKMTLENGDVLVKKIRK